MILGGTGDAAALAEALAGEPSLHVINSLAGRTSAPRPLPGETRLGGFGGVRGLIDYLGDREVDLVIDATHPFAAAMSRHAAEACDHLGIPKLYLARPPWRAEDGDIWHEAADAGEAAALLETLGQRVFLSSGQQDLDVFAGLDDHWFLIRTLEPVSGVKPKQALCLEARGPFDEAEEIRLLETHRIDVLVTKASGGAATYSKITAARQLGLPVIMIRRPELPSGPSVGTVEAALEWLRRQVSDAAGQSEGSSDHPAAAGD